MNLCVVLAVSKIIRVLMHISWVQEGKKLKRSEYLLTDLLLWWPVLGGITSQNKFFCLLATAFLKMLHFSDGGSDSCCGQLFKRHFPSIELSTFNEEVPLRNRRWREQVTCPKTVMLYCVLPHVLKHFTPKNFYIFFLFCVKIVCWRNFSHQEDVWHEWDKITTKSWLRWVWDFHTKYSVPGESPRVQ